MKASELLLAARSLISQPQNWTKRQMAKDKRGYTVGPHSEAAVCFCSAGAIFRKHNGPLHQLDTATACLRQACYDGWHIATIVDFNDHKDTTHEDVMKAFDKAIKLAKALELAKEQ